MRDDLAAGAAPDFTIARLGARDRSIRATY